MEVFEDNEESSAEDYIDPLKAVRSPPPQPPSKSESIKGRPAVSPRSWSTSINTFFPEDCVCSPLIHPAGMDAETFNPLMISIRREIHNVEQKIKGFTAAHVRLDLKEEVSTRLEKIDDCNNVCQGKIFDIIMLSGENVPSNVEKTNTLRKLADDLNSKVLNNT